MQNLLSIIKDNNLELSHINVLNTDHKLPLWTTFINLHQITNTPDNTLTNTLLSIRNGILIPGTENFNGLGIYNSPNDLVQTLSTEAIVTYNVLSKIQKKSDILFIYDITLHHKNLNHLKLFLDILPTIKTGLPSCQNTYIVLFIEPENDYILSTLKKYHWKIKATNYYHAHIAIYPL